MEETTQQFEQPTEQPTVQQGEIEAIREVCHHNMPEDIWQALEAKGIETTPGMIYQAFNHAEPTATDHPKAAPNGAIGLTADDHAALSALAAKAGGVEQLIRILAVWQKVPK